MGGMYQNFPGYAPQQHATLSLANQLGQLLNGTVVRTNPVGPVAPPPQYALDFGTGTDPRNAGLMAQIFQTEDPGLAQRRIADEESYLRNPPQFSQAQGITVAPTINELMAQGKIPRIPTSPQPQAAMPTPIFVPAPGGHQAGPGPSLAPTQVAAATQAFAPQQPSPQAVAPSPVAAPAPTTASAPTGGGLAEIGALLTGLMGGSGGSQINLQNPATYSPGAGMGGFQPMQSLFASPQYSRSQPAALSSYLGRSRGY